MKQIFAINAIPTQFLQNCIQTAETWTTSPKIKPAPKLSVVTKTFTEMQRQSPSLAEEPSLTRRGSGEVHGVAPRVSYCSPMLSTISRVQHPSNELI